MGEDLGEVEALESEGLLEGSRNSGLESAPKYLYEACRMVVCLSEGSTVSKTLVGMSLTAETACSRAFARWEGRQGL